MMSMRQTPSPSHVEPVLAVNNVSETVQYWHDILGFPDKWTWREPATHGGVAWNGTFIQFSQNPELALSSKGNSIFIRVRNIEGLYDFYQKKDAVIAEQLENKPWGLSGYTLKEINGYYIVFAGALLSDKKNKSTDLPASIRIIARSPTMEEYRQLASSVGWRIYLDDIILARLLQAPVFAVVAEDRTTNSAIGCALLLSDRASLYYIKDVIVYPDWQSRHVGTMLMNSLMQWMQWMQSSGTDQALVTLITPESLSPFYRQFGFVPAFGMVTHIQREK
jgi:GNAT superfamily N-acetyltransferase/uncharacterized glyoxalase superfamily protein PhnB